MTITLQKFYEQIKDCQKCMLASSRTQVVFGHGNPQAEIMFVGEAPGFTETARAHCAQLDLPLAGLMA
jgi:uracil-DNA glycosylase